MRALSLSCKYLHLVFGPASALCDLLYRKNASLPGTGTNLFAYPTSQGGHWGQQHPATPWSCEETFQTWRLLVAQNPCLRKSQEFPRTVWDLWNLGGYPGFRKFWSGNLDLELQCAGTRHKGGERCFWCGFSTIQTPSQATPTIFAK